MSSIVRNELLSKLNKLSNGTETRESVSEWAFSILNDDNVVVTDKVIWRVLEALGAVDTPNLESNYGYLYTSDDFDEWRKLLENHKI